MIPLNLRTFLAAPVRRLRAPWSPMRPVTCARCSPLLRLAQVRREVWSAVVLATRERETELAHEC